MKCESLYHEFKRYEGQPVKVYMEDGHCFTGISLMAYDDAVRILDKCGRTVYLDYAHVDAVVEPMMKLDRCCEAADHCECRGEDYDRGEQCAEPFEGMGYEGRRR